MKVEALVSAAGPPGKFSFRTGDVMNLPEDEAQILLDAGAVRLLEPVPGGRGKKSEKVIDPAVKKEPVSGKAPNEDGSPTVKTAE